jgi:hypothetical protein
MRRREFLETVGGWILILTVALAIALGGAFLNRWMSKRHYDEGRFLSAQAQAKGWSLQTWRLDGRVRTATTIGGKVVITHILVKNENEEHFLPVECWVDGYSPLEPRAVRIRFVGYRKWGYWDPTEPSDFIEVKGISPGQ